MNLYVRRLLKKLFLYVISFFQFILKKNIVKVVKRVILLKYFFSEYKDYVNEMICFFVIVGLNFEILI